MWKREASVIEIIKQLDRYTKRPDWDDLSREERLNLLQKGEWEAVKEQQKWCSEDFTYAARNYFWITDNNGQDVLLDLWEAQYLILQLWYDLKSQGKPQKIYIIKGRQIGASILIEAMIAWATIFFPNTEALVVSVDQPHASYLFGLMLHIYDRLPWWLRPELASREEKDGLWFDKKDPEKRATKPGMNSRVYVQWSTQYSGVGQGRKILACHACFNPNTIVRLADGRLKRITECIPGEDRAITASGRVTPIKAVVKSFRKNELMSEIYLWGNPVPLSTTVDHRILTPSGYRQAGKIGSGDYVSIPVRKISQAIPDFNITNFPTGGHSGFTLEDRKRTGGTVRYPLSREWGWLFGLYLAEGSLVSNGNLKPELKYGAVVFSIHEKEVESFSARLRAAIPADRKLAIRRTNSKTVNLAVSWAGIARFTEEEFGHSDSKTIPAWVWGAGRDFCLGLVDGYLSGDGSWPDEDIKVCATSIRATLPMQVRDLIASLGFGWSALAFHPAGERYNRNCRAAWTISVNGDSAIALREEFGRPARKRKAEPTGGHHWRYSKDKLFIEAEVESVGDGFCEEVYDLEVESAEHNFCTIQCCVANSELTDWYQPRARKIVEGDLLHAIKDTPRAFGFLETTGKEAGSYSHRLWRRCEKMAELSEWYPLFLPWFFEPSRKRMVTVDWVPKKPELSMRERIRREWVKCMACNRYTGASLHGASREGTSCPFCKIGILVNVTLTDEQLFWKEVKRRNAEETDQESYKEHLVELASTAEESFQLQGHAIFGAECQERVTATIIDPEKTPGVQTGYFDTARRFHGLDGTRPTLDHEGRTTYRCYLDQCNVNHMADLEQFNCTIWEPPLEGFEYSCGVDVAEGIGLDYSVIFITKFGKFGNPDEQVFRLRDNHIETLDLAFYCDLIGRWYNNALMCVEYEGIGKSTADHVLRTYDYPNVYRWKHLDSVNVLSNKWHWYTKPDTRQKLWQTARKWIKCGAWVIRSKNFLAEMQDFQKDEDDSKSADHSDGGFSDELMAGMISLYAGHEGEADERGTIGVPIVEDRVGAPRFQMICNSCHHEWPASDPTYNSQCPQCYSHQVIGKPLETFDNRASVGEVGFNQDGSIVLSSGKGVNYSPDRLTADML